ncbi:methanogen output domain 1-containing protein [Alteromonas ponticola]|uniref:Methanogen output domain 1-containing protein n=1 Tax=Alteromonas aquimaris TaxID=2998417 RepID=A0ABT3P314_9ALTE|nr:methanogen output domain 1-containing protein [Alteromonas aquimaris]MCW8107172.1 methanogen output domain 1-containing protein [Alteromonas aquimaris]
MDDKRIDILEIPLERDGFLRLLIRHLSGTLQDVVGVEEAAGFVSVVGQKVGEEIDHSYRNALQVDKLTRNQVGKVLVDLKRRIQGDFYIIEENSEKIVLGNRQCPFEDKVIGRPAMCMMTSNVFGTITAENLGYARVELDKTIAQGHPECRVIVHLKRTPGEQVRKGREYYQV